MADRAVVLRILEAPVWQNCAPEEFASDADMGAPGIGRTWGEVGWGG